MCVCVRERERERGGGGETDTERDMVGGGRKNTRIISVNVKQCITIESDYAGTKFYYQMSFISLSELCSRI